MFREKNVVWSGGLLFFKRKGGSHVKEIRWFSPRENNYRYVSKIEGKGWFSLREKTHRHVEGKRIFLSERRKQAYEGNKDGFSEREVRQLYPGDRRVSLK